MRNVYVVTHTEATHHLRSLVGGWRDYPLTENGRDQAARIAASLHKETGTDEIPIYSSDLQRCSEMADIFTRVFGGSVVLDERLREMRFGRGEGKARDWSKKNVNPKPADGNRLDYRIFEGSETRREVGTRVGSIVDEIGDKPGDYAIIITHGFALSFVIMAWMRVPVDGMGHGSFPTASGGVTLLSVDDFFGSRSVVYVGRRDYLAG